MFLKSINASGFKSFADKTNVEVKSGITCIVGPNGSGKSNIVDAVKWVLGEQSVKSLRGSNSMTDVIFAGSKSRPEQNRAVVSLHFDNSDHYLNSEFNDIEVKRIVYKNGENEYYINNAKVRLKDITDLFIDSGAGKESFNIISQGSVADIINSKPLERRSIFEEAAGVLKYKKRKEESLRKLEKTKENLDKVELLISELSTSVEPLREQSKVAKQFLEIKEELQNIEIALIASDIKNLNQESENLKKTLNKAQENLEKVGLANNQDSAEVEKLKLLSIKLDEEISSANENLIAFEKKLAELQAQKQLVIERKKYEVEDSKLQSNIINLKEEELTIKKNIENITSTIEYSKQDLKKLEDAKKIIEEEYFKVNNECERLERYINEKSRYIFDLASKIDVLNDNIENDTRLPYAVKCCLNNPRLKGINGTIGKLIEIEPAYVIAIDTALGYNSNVIVVDNEACAKDAINYLKENKLGRATFFPLNIIKEKHIDNATLDKMKSIPGVIDVASNLVKYDNKFSNIIKNQLGNIIVVDTIDTLNLVGKLIEYKYRVVSLDGEILYSGGAITGGASKNASSVLNLKNELEELTRKQEDAKIDIDQKKEQLTSLEIKQAELVKEQSEKQREIIIAIEKLTSENTTLNDLNRTYEEKKKELEGTENLKNNRLDEEIESILEIFYKTTSEKELKEKQLEVLKQEKFDVSNKIAEQEQKIRSINSEYNKYQNEIKDTEIRLGKIDVKLDSLLINLNENYNLTYEKAINSYSLDLEEDLARIKVNKLKANIRALGDVNMGSIAEFERVNTRYTFLLEQSEDLNKATNSLLDVINEMDEIMKDKFKESFDMISTEFQNVFKKLFKGGEGRLELTDPDNILETGIEIVAQPPGKKLSSIVLMSGGEKTLTAIALLFAILNVKPVPFCILDEVEAALDEANVDAFGNYLISKKDKSQFIIITHKKRTMEYADILYGITMQESGVSKIVSVKLEG